MKHSTCILCICFVNSVIKKIQFAGILLCKVGAGLGSVTLHNVGNVMIVLK